MRKIEGIFTKEMRTDLLFILERDARRLILSLPIIHMSKNRHVCRSNRTLGLLRGALWRQFTTSEPTSELFNVIHSDTDRRGFEFAKALKYLLDLSCEDRVVTATTLFKNSQYSSSSSKS